MSVTPPRHASGPENATAAPAWCPSPSRRASQAADWESTLAGAGEMGARIRAFDWSATPLGPIGEWPPSLREVLITSLWSRFQLAIYWGPKLVLLYNDAERDVLGTMHPHALGRPDTEILADIWDVVGPMLQGVMTTGVA